MALRRAVRRDRPFVMGPKAIREVEFRERVRGYDPAQVDPLLDEVADIVAALEDAITAAAPGPPPEPVEAPYERAVALVAALLHLRATYEQANELLGDARRRARAIEHDARVERRRLLRAAETV